MCEVDNDSLTALFLFLTLAQSQAQAGLAFRPSHKLQADGLRPYLCSALAQGPFQFPFQTVLPALSKIFLPALAKKFCRWKQQNSAAGGDPRKC
jgi:hypothetical protein